MTRLTSEAAECLSLQVFKSRLRDCPRLEYGVEDSNIVFPQQISCFESPGIFLKVKIYHQDFSKHGGRTEKRRQAVLERLRKPFFWHNSGLWS